MYDVLILGMSAAGLSASLYIARAGLSAALIGKDGGSLEKAHKIENYFGTGAVSGAKLLEKGRRQAKTVGAELIFDEVVGAEYDGKSYNVKTDKAEYSSKALVLALGNARNKPSVKGISEFEGRGVSYCAVCDGFFFKNRDVAVLGAGNYALSEAEYLKNIAKSVTILTNGEELSGENVITDEIDYIAGKDALSKVVFKSGKELPVSGFFVAQGFAGSAELANKLGVFCVNGVIKTDEKMATNLPGCFAAGDCTGGVAQVSVAVGEGAKAGLSAIEYLKK